MQKRHQKTLQAIFRQPTSGTVAFADIESLILALGGEVEEARELLERVGVKA